MKDYASIVKKIKIMVHLKSRLQFFMVLLFVVMVFGTVGFMIVEGLSFADAFYFSIVTVATVGYGDISPGTTAGRMLAILLILTGVGTFLGVVANTTEIFLSKRDKEIRMEKLNMVIGIFFTEIGSKLLIYFTGYDTKIGEITKDLMVTEDWSNRSFSMAEKNIKDYSPVLALQKAHLEKLHSFLMEKSNIFLRMLENQNLIEHESFTELLMALLHLKEELHHREFFNNLPDSDYEHLAIDINRVYLPLIRQWLDYMKHLKDNYPYLFSLAMRTNPFNKERTPVVE